MALLSLSRLLRTEQLLGELFDFIVFDVDFGAVLE